MIPALGGKSTSYYAHARSELLPLLRPTEVFEEGVEIGCADGETLGLLVAESRVRRGVGVERWPEAARRARERLSAVIEADIEEWITTPSGVSQPDLVIAADVLEHLSDPWGVLGGMRRLQRRGGVLLLSIPNVQHYSVSVPLLLAGRWRYAAEGLLDRTHLRFFTRHSIVELVEGAGYSIEQWAFTAGPRGRLLVGLSGGLLRPWFAFQYLLRCRAA